MCHRQCYVPGYNELTRYILLAFSLHWFFLIAQLFLGDLFKSPCMTAKTEGISDHFSACSVHCPADEFYVTVLKCVPIFMLSHEWIHFPLQFTTGFSNFDILLITFSPCLVFSSSRKCETLGYWSAMFSNNNDEDRPHQAYWVYGIFKKVWHLFTLSKNTVKLPSSSFDFFVSAVFDLFPSHLFFFYLLFNHL